MKIEQEFIKRKQKLDALGLVEDEEITFPRVLEKLSSTTITIKAKDVFDSIGLKTGRCKYSTLIDVISKILPNAKMVMF
jgi:hypothetical protein